MKFNFYDSTSNWTQVKYISVRICFTMSIKTKIHWYDPLISHTGWIKMPLGTEVGLGQATLTC